MGMIKWETLEEIVIIGGLVGIQIIYAGNSVLLSHLLSTGLDPILLVIFTTLASFLLFAPLAAFFEWKLWPNSISFKLMTKLVLAALTGATSFQLLYLKGLKLTSPSVATAMPNLSPAFIFIIAWALGMEKVKLSCMYSRVKIGGTVLCVMGALIMSLMHSATTSPDASKSVETLAVLTDDIFVDKDKILGCLYLLLAILCISSTVILQASILMEFPAPMSMLTMVSFIGMITTVALQYLLNGSIEMGSSSVIGLGPLIGYATLGGLISGGGYSINGWVIKKKGPVLVSMFTPIATVVCVVFSTFSGERFNLGSFVGMALMFGGLYFVMWAKGKESNEEQEEDICKEEEEEGRTEFDLQKPLLL